MTLVPNRFSVESHIPKKSLMSVITAIGYEWIFVLVRAKTSNAGASWGYKLKRLLWFKTMTNIE